MGAFAMVRKFVETGGVPDVDRPEDVYTEPWSDPRFRGMGMIERPLSYWLRRVANNPSQFYASFGSRTLRKDFATAVAKRCMKEKDHAMFMSGLVNMLVAVEKTSGKAPSLLLMPNVQWISRMERASAMAMTTGVTGSFGVGVGALSQLCRDESHVLATPVFTAEFDAQWISFMSMETDVLPVLPQLCRAESSVLATPALPACVDDNSEDDDVEEVD
tara:strand:- start:3987 stop:4637 length:651 start_codon:yes stop_codon:yes gene_type:complete